MRQSTPRSALLKSAFAVLLVAAGLFAAPWFMQRAYASESECSANCRNGSCSATGSCTCSCSWITGVPVCSCSASQPEQENPVIPPNS